MSCPWCGNDGTMTPVPGDAGKAYDKCPKCHNFVPKPIEVPSIRVERYVTEHGEKYRRLVIDALAFLDKHEPTWGLDTPIDVDAYIANLVKETI